MFLAIAVFGLSTETKPDPGNHQMQAPCSNVNRHAYSLDSPLVVLNVGCASRSPCRSADRIIPEGIVLIRMPTTLSIVPQTSTVSVIYNISGLVIVLALVPILRHPYSFVTRVGSSESM
jgi:hypothetical protein